MVAILPRCCLFALVLFLAAALARAEAPKKAGVPDTGLVMGDVYTLRVERNGVHEQFTGNLAKLNERWIVLHYVATKKNDGNTSNGLLPFLGRKPTSAPIGRRDEFLWIPRDAATIEARTQVTDRTHVAVPEGETPPEHTACAIELVAAGKAVHRQGGIEAVANDGLTISFPKKVKATFNVPTTPETLASLTNVNVNRVETHYMRQHLATRDILCVRVAHFDPASIEQAP